jgi:lipoprotein-releasing system ATP-binding protein
MSDFSLNENPWSAQSDPVLLAHAVGKRFEQGPLRVDVLDGVDLSLSAGQSLAIVGASGSGKSTLLHILGGLESATTGQVQLMGHDLSLQNTTQLGRLRNQHLGFVYQFHHLLPEFSAWENVAMPLWLRRADPLESRAKALVLLKRLGLEHRAEHRPSELSGGERQRVAMARALVTQPACVLADEPTGNLDRATAKEVFNLMLEFTKSFKTSFIVVTHDHELARMCESTLYLKNGQLNASPA